jgi:3-oxoacyl-[acyl-carrier protein] reductase
MDLGLRDKVALVTGGSHGLGEAICLALAAEGARVAVNYRRSPERADALVARLTREGGTQAVAVAGDVTCEADVAAMFDRAEAALGPVAILINNAGVCPVAKVAEMPLATWEETLRTNLTGAFLASREMVRRTTAAGLRAAIVSVASPAAFVGSASGKAHYAASKAGLVALTVSLARETAGQGLRVNAVAPGMMATEMTADILRTDAERYARTIPLGRVAETREVADVVAFLASDRAAYITGATVDVSGGLLMR